MATKTRRRKVDVRLGTVQSVDRLFLTELFGVLLLVGYYKQAPTKRELGQVVPDGTSLSVLQPISDTWESSRMQRRNIGLLS